MPCTKARLGKINSPIIPKKIEAFIKSLPSKISSGPDGFKAEFYQTFKEGLLASSTYSTKIETEGLPPNNFYKATVTQITKFHKVPTKKGNFRPISLMNIYAKNQNYHKLNPRTHQKCQVGFIPGLPRCFNM